MLEEAAGEDARHWQSAVCLPQEYDSKNHVRVSSLKLTDQNIAMHTILNQLA